MVQRRLLLTWIGAEVESGFAADVSCAFMWMFYGADENSSCPKQELRNAENSPAGTFVAFTQSKSWFGFCFSYLVFTIRCKAADDFRYDRECQSGLTDLQMRQLVSAFSWRDLSRRCFGGKSPHSRATKR